MTEEEIELLAVKVAGKVAEILAQRYLLNPMASFPVVIPLFHGNYNSNISYTSWLPTSTSAKDIK